ncbi:hypothetical protein RV11_GL001507 [Enterococcus phoeniculicola]|jgi:uncharacterized beta-barrel protein YwiB (DUF1934 family)|uniref:DUF1934 domain-containing protein n=1 Tax=Enterococcus phoeniculicola ATCC BAA-412 TaxID=1158610 RepID=R3W3Y1_9ENTE|nr:DUF1934 domain-containing protein [Enterococcus phoeniculicola]EOL42206.1 hypothetical protein UC3_02557 [Enterococcus phoeniculicola ATCC BAA-412]EOT79515.1 hypothetical protein I589_01024 [Enterococcus phoeniculicola ATCC BAA-412]OJG70367.1 hypothetical protein RV11_GL001507 [Enterococcus phoeniculicola]
MDLTQGMPVSIQLATKVIQNNEVQDFYFDLTGQVVKIADTLYIRYKEIQEDTGEEVPVTIKVTPDGRIQLIRAGEMRMRLKFGYQERLETNYRTPYGMLTIHTFTKNLRFSLKDRPVSGKIVIDYDLYMVEDKIGEYHLTLDFTA